MLEANLQHTNNIYTWLDYYIQEKPWRYLASISPLRSLNGAVFRNIQSWLAGKRHLDSFTKRPGKN
jgi:hypothetical protein